MTFDERVTAVLVELDGIARDVCHYDYGLPLFTDGARERMADVVAQAIRDAVAEATEWAARVAVEAAEHHRNHCPPGCRCADGWHIACRIREGKA